MGLCKDIKKLRLDFQPIAKWIINLARDRQNTNLIINETLRDDSVQQAYYAQGRKTLDEVNNLRKIAGLYFITESENHGIITNVPHVSLIAGHGAGLAMDVVPDGKWNSPPEKWAVIGQCVEDAKLFFSDELKKLNADIIWGGNYKSFNDSPHTELKYNV